MENKSKTIFVIIMIIMLIPFSAAAEQSELKVCIDGEYVDFEDTTGYPYIDENNRIQVPFRVTLEAFGAIVSWNNELKIAVAEKNDIKVVIPIGQSYIEKDEEKIMNDTISVIKEDRVYLPIRIVMECFDCNVTWNSDEKTVVATSADPQEISEIYLDLFDYKQKVKENEVLIEGRTNADNILKIDGKEVAVGEEERFYYLFTDLDPEENKIIISAENVETGEKIEREINVYYEVIETEDGSEEEIQEGNEDEQEDSKIYLDLRDYNKRVKKNRVGISGRTNPDNILKINGKEVIIAEDGEFNYIFTNLNRGENNTIVVSVENDETGEKIEEEINVYYKVVEDDYEEEEDQEKIYKEGFDNEESEYEDPVITLDKEIPEVTDQESFIITGTYENVGRIIINGPYKNIKVEMKDNKFSHTIKLSTGKDGWLQTEKGVLNVIQIIAANGDKMLVKEYVVYYKEESE